MILNKSKKGFTLIELMVVIAIIGILATAGITQFSQYQARSRDTVRIQNIGAVKTMLGTYFSDFGEYPAEKTQGCLSDNKGVVTDDFKEYVGSKLPLDPQSGNESLPCSQKRAMGYKVLSRNSVDKSAYILTTNTETKQKSNYIWNGVDSLDSAEDFEDSLKETTKNPSDSGNASANANTVIYAELN